MFSQSVRSVMKRQKLLTATPETTVSKAGVLMTKRNVGAVMIVERGRLIQAAPVGRRVEVEDRPLHVGHQARDRLDPGRQRLAQRGPAHLRRAIQRA